MKHIVIVGGGLGGLTLANALQQLTSDVKVTLLERDRDAASRPQGYGIGLTKSGGLGVLKRLGLLEEIEKAATSSLALRFLTPAGRTLLLLPPQPPASDRYVIMAPRDKLRAVLLRNVADTVRWGMRCVGYRAGPRPTVQLEDGGELSADLIVACDGVRSRLRAQMHGDSLHYLGLSGVGGVVRRPVSHPLIAAGTFMTLGRGKSFFVSEYGGGAAIWFLTMHATEKQFLPLAPSGLRELVQREVGDWHEPISELISNTQDSDLTVRDLYDREPLPVAHTTGVVLLGDACHPMTPFRGQGGNAAMTDALRLAEALAAPGVSFDAALPVFEREMLRRTRPLVLQSRRAADDLHTSSRFATWWRNMTFRLLHGMISLSAGRNQAAKT
jgi:2-polyprenyl-6-methoxyphenol hydroxylase-like FAD-dependent oxidoreductase